MMERWQVTDAQLDDAWLLFRQRLNEAIVRKGPGVFVSRHEALGAITEEYLEFAEAVRTGKGVADEAADVGIAAFWAFVSEHVYDPDCP